MYRFLAVFLLLPFVAVAQPQSKYSSLKPAKCRTVSSSDMGGVFRCMGLNKYTIELAEGDLRQNITLINPAGKRQDLEMWNHKSGFSSLGDTAEWRFAKAGASPKALIVRYKVSEDPEDSTKITSYLAVIKISPQKTCVIDYVAPGAKQNETARSIADASGSKSCWSETH